MRKATKVRRVQRCKPALRSLPPILALPMKYIDSMGISHERAIATLKAGCPLAFPTDTVWGIGVAVEFCPSPAALFAAKGRPSNKPVAWLVGSACDLAKYGKDVPDYAMELAQKSWPGALTLVVRASARVGGEWSSSEGTIGLRMPNSDIAARLIADVGCPLATTSANVSGAPSVPASSPLEGDIAKILGVEVFDSREWSARPAAESEDGCQGEVGATSAMAASTVIDCTAKEPRILRAGPVRL